jgi:callose synthase
LLDQPPKRHVANFLFDSGTSLLLCIVVVDASRQRLYSGLSSAIISGFLVFTYLEPMFVPVGSETALVALYVLTADGTLVGMSLGVMVPTLFPGICTGATLSCLVGVLGGIVHPLFFPVSAITIGILCAFLSVR